MKVIAKRHIRHNKVKYVPGQEIPADQLGKGLDTLKREFDHLEVLLQDGAVELVVVEEKASEEAVSEDAPKKAKKAKA